MPHLPASTPLDIQLRRPYTSLGVFLPAGMTESADEQRTIDALANRGIDLFQIGVPCPTPFLDGPVIASAYYEALARGTHVHDVLGTVSYASTRAPAVVMTYWESVALYGPRRFAREMKTAGAAGIMVVDLPDAQARIWSDTLAEAGLSSPRLVLPHTTDAALAQACATASGWLYAPAAQESTGYQGPLDLAALARSVRRLRKASALPVVAGIGISTPALARAVAPLVNGVMVGSPIVGALASTGRAAAAGLVADFATAVVTPVEKASHG
ncbi:tryptophan synthase subunit alpha [Streptomyces sp. NPDC058409]|uniref:tryptophan synthase subunit alpha n=1 Tax=Streptomyces sp. NPDC058409 TaxID=3346484 RepID=UPI00365E8E14